MNHCKVIMKVWIYNLSLALKLDKEPVVALVETIYIGYCLRIDVCWSIKY